MDIVLIEGYRLDAARKIEVLRPGFTDRPIAEPAQLLATYGQRLYAYEIPHLSTAPRSSWPATYTIISTTCRRSPVGRIYRGNLVGRKPGELGKPARFPELL